MEILEHGVRYQRKEFICTYCHCRFRANHGEYSENVQRDGHDIIRSLVCKCPECGHEVASNINRAITIDISRYIF